MHRTKRPEDRNAIAVVDRGIQTLKKDLATRVARKGGQWSDHFERGAYNARPHETVHGAPEDVEKQPATGSCKTTPTSSSTTRTSPTGA